MSRMSKRLVTMNLTLETIAQLDEMAGKLGISRTAMVTIQSNTHYAVFNGTYRDLSEKLYTEIQESLRGDAH